MNDLERFTDFGNAERLIINNIQDIRYCRDSKKWLIWNGQRWIFDDGIHMVRLAMDTIRKISEEATAVKEDPDLARQLLDHAIRSQTPSRVKAMIFLAQSDPDIQISSEALDADQMTLNCLNGVVDLRTGELQDHSRDKMMTKICPVNYNTEAVCPLFFDFVDEIMAGDIERIAYLQKIFGYCLTGRTCEQVLFFFVGDGANGKSTLLEIFREILGDYARHTPSTTLTSHRGIRNDIARLKGARFVSSVEIGLGAKIDEVLVKQMTGGDPVTSRFLYNEYFELNPTFKLLIAMNNDPEIRGVDHGIWRRIRLIPFDKKITEDEIDKDILTKMKAEFPGILNWAVRGCLEWQKNGLTVPPKVSTMTQMLKSENDVVGLFLSDCCNTEPETKISLKDLFELYHAWSLENACEVMPKKTFGGLLKQKGYRQCKSDGKRFWRGISKKQVAKTYPTVAVSQDVIVNLH